MNVLKNHCLFYFQNTQEFNEIVKDNRIDSWWILAQPLADRTDRTINTSRYQFLQKQNNLTNTTTNPQEIISWIDTMNFMFYMLDALENKNDIKIIQELKIPYSNKRPDYLLLKDNKILIIEFSFEKLGNEFQYENKLTQAIGYKELLSNILPSHIQIGTYTYLIKAEADENLNQIQIQSKYKPEKVDPNYDGRIEMAKYIDNYFSTTKQSAINELSKIV